MVNKLKFYRYGTPKGKIVIYFHGAPGSPQEAVIFDSHAKAHHLNLICYDRFSIDSKMKDQAYYQYLAKIIAEKANGHQIDLIGYSIGCHTAIETSIYLENIVSNLHIIAPVAPLDAENFLADMAGKRVFSAATNYPSIFTLFSYWQSLATKIAPHTLFKILFASTTGADKELAKTKEFEDYIKPILHHCFTRNIKGYMREINQYVKPWKESVSHCRINTHIWHGTSDNWSPISMANYLRDNLPMSGNVESMKNLSHYSCLFAAAPKICAQLAEK